MHQPSSETSSAPVARRASRIAAGQLVADVELEALVGVLVVGHAPVEQQDVEALVEQELDERVPGPQVEDVAAG